MNTKNLFLALLISTLLMPFAAHASIDKNLYYGLTNDDQVSQLQTFLISKGDLNGTVTGNFYGKTLGAVQVYQSSQHITPTGFVGPVTRTAINTELAGQTPVLVQDQSSIIEQLKAQIASLQAQLTFILSQQNQTPQPTPTPTPQPQQTSTPNPVTQPTQQTNNNQPNTQPIMQNVALVVNHGYNNPTFNVGAGKNKIASFVVSNPSDTDSVTITDLTIDLTLSDGASVSNFSNLYVKFAGKNQSNAVQPVLSNALTANELLTPGQQEIVDVYVDNNLGASTIQPTLTIDSVAVAGQVATFK